MITIDGSTGEGGGQIIRTALTLSLITGRAFAIDNIRANRSPGGLKEQHLSCVRACQALSGAIVEGDATGSTKLTFAPGPPRFGAYTYPIATAGSASLVLQCVFYPLALLDESSDVTITGGTHVRWSPSFEYLEEQWRPMVEQAGFRCRLTLERAGYYPRGGGILRAHIKRKGRPQEFRKLARGPLQLIEVILGSSNLPGDVNKRMERAVSKDLRKACKRVTITPLTPPSMGINAFICIKAVFQHCAASFCAVGERGKPAEKVAREALEEFQFHFERKGALDEHMADQVLLPLALQEKGSYVYTTSRITRHLLTNADIIRMFLPVAIDIEGDPGGEGKVTVRV